MKQLRKLHLLLVLIFTAFLLTACEEDDDDDDTPRTSNQSAVIKAEVTANLQNGNWRVFKMIDSGQNETQDFNGYIFTFQSNGVVSAVKNNTTYNGNWNITDSDSNDDSQDDLDFNLNFSQPPSFSDLNDDWDFISQSASKIELIDISGGNGGVDSLTFVKN
jgi:hypothetical protein